MRLRGKSTTESDDYDTSEGKLSTKSDNYETSEGEIDDKKVSSMRVQRAETDDEKWRLWYFREENWRQKVAITAKMATAGLGGSAEWCHELQFEEPYGMGRSVMLSVLLPGDDAACSYFRRFLTNKTAVSTTGIVRCFGRYVCRRPKGFKTACIVLFPRRAIPRPTLGRQRRSYQVRSYERQCAGWLLGWEAPSVRTIAS